eukprot:628135-Amphidinium_carterae.1
MLGPRHLQELGHNTHRSIEHDKEELPRVALDFGFLKDLNGSLDTDRPITFVAALDSNTRHVFAMPLTRKGATDFATAKLVEWLKSLGHRRLILQSDGEPAMLKLKEEVRMQLPDVEVIPRESAVGDHKSNGAAEAAIRRVKDMTRCQDVPRPDGRTAEELSSGRAWRKTTAVFGERVLGYRLKLDSKKRDLDAKAVSGLFVGYAPRTATTLLLTEQGVLRTRGMARQTEPERRNYKLETYRTGTPWDYNEHEEQPGETVTAVPPPELVPSQMVPVVARPPATR